MTNKNEVSDSLISENEEKLDEIIEDLISDVPDKPIQESISEENAEPPKAEPKIEEKPLEVTQSNSLVLPSKKDILRDDPLIKGILNEEGVFDLLDIVLGELAEESASLKYERIKKELENKDTDRLSLRRSNILKMISDALVQKRNLALNDFVNLRSPQWQIVFEQIMKKIRQTFVDLNYSSEQLELFFQKFQSNLDGFEESTEVKLRESLSRSD